MHEHLIRHIREMLALTQQDLAERLDVSQATVSRWESGRSKPDMAARRRIQGLARRKDERSDAALMRMVQQSPSMMGLFDMDMRVLMMSTAAARAHRVNLNEVVGFDYRTLFTDELEQAYNFASQAGFFAGQTLGIEICCRINGLKGDEFFVRANWHLLPRPSGEDHVLVWNGHHLSREDYDTIRVDGFARAISVDDWMNEMWPGSAADAIPSLQRTA